MPVRYRAFLAIVVFVLSCPDATPGNGTTAFSDGSAAKSPVGAQSFQSEVSVYDCIDIHETVNQQVEQSHYLLVPEPIDALGLRVVTCLSAQTMPGRGDAVTDDYTESQIDL